MACRLNAEELADLMRVYKEDPAALADAIRTRMDPKFSGKLIELWKAGLLSGPQTHIVNAVGGGLFQGVRLMEKAMSERINAGLAAAFPTKFARDRFAGETAAALHGGKSVLPEALTKLAEDSKDAFTGKPEKLDLDNDGKFDHIVGAVGGKTGRVARIPFRMLSAADDFWKATIRSQELHRQAYRQASREGKAGEALTARMQDIMSQVHDVKDQGVIPVKIREAMKRVALEETWQTPLGPTGRGLQQFSQSHPLAGVIMPFVKTPANISKDILARTPFGYWRAFQKFRQLKAGKAELGEFTDELAKPILGTIVGASVMMLAEGGTFDITGGGPVDFAEQQNLKQTGWQPYSIKIGDTYVSYKRFEPVSAVLGIAADLREAKDAKTKADLAQKLFDAITTNITDQTFLTGLAGAARVAQDPQRYGKQWVKQMEGTLVPNLVAKTAQAIDPIDRETDAFQTVGGIPEPIAARIPWLSKMLPARRTPTGEEKERPGGRLGAISPVQISEEKGPEADLEREFARVKWVPPQPSKDFAIKRSGGKKAELSDDEYKLLQDAYIKAAREARQVIRTSGYRRLPDTAEEAAGRMSKERVLQDIYNRAKRDARERLEAGVTRRWKREQA